MNQLEAFETASRSPTVNLNRSAERSVGLTLSRQRLWAGVRPNNPQQNPAFQYCQGGNTCSQIASASDDRSANAGLQGKDGRFRSEEELHGCGWKMQLIRAFKQLWILHWLRDSSPIHPQKGHLLWRFAAGSQQTFFSSLYPATWASKVSWNKFCLSSIASHA